MKPEEKRKIYSERVAETTKLEPSVPIIIKGKSYNLEFNLRAAKAIQDGGGVNLLKEGITTSDLQDANKLALYLSSGLTKNHPDITTDVILDQLDIRHFPYYMDRIIEAQGMFAPNMDDILGGDSSQDPQSQTQ